jgi:NhaB family Na+:H+ antiporter
MTRLRQTRSFTAQPYTEQSNTVNFLAFARVSEMNESAAQAFWHNFLGPSPEWYKKAIIGFLLINPVLLFLLGPFVTGWVLIAEFIFTLALALRCYPLQPGGLLAIEAVVLGMTSPHTVFHEAEANFEVILLLMFMVAGIYFMKELLLFVFTRILLKIRSKIMLSLLFSLVAAVLSAFLDALTVTAVLISVGVGFYSVYHKVASGKGSQLDDHDHGDDASVQDSHKQDLEEFRSFLRSLLMHGAVGTALGGVCTLVGEPQNLLIASVADWDFIKFLVIMAPVTMPVLVFGLMTCALLEVTGKFGYGAKLPANVRLVLEEFQEQADSQRNTRTTMRLTVQVVVAIILVLGLAFHLAEVGLIGLMVIVLLTAFNGVVEEHQIGHAFEEALPFTALLVVFFAIVAVIHDQHLFTPVIDAVLAMDATIRPAMFFLANGVLSMISDNVFVATVYINEVKAALDAGTITRSEFDQLAVAINTGTNLPSVATPNGQAAFLFLLTSALAPLIRLSYGRMVIMALPYTVVLGGVGLACVSLFI